MNIGQWAVRHGVTPGALQELVALLSATSDHVPPPGATGSEASAQQQVMLEAPRHNERVFRNNVGACVDDRGNHIRYGLANVSKAMNKKVKSSDLIGIKSHVVVPADVGKTHGIFTAREVKPPGWTYRATGREPAQLAFIQLVNGMGGIAQFTTGPHDIWLSS